MDSLSAIGWGRGPGRGGALACWPDPLPAGVSQGEGGTPGQCQDAPISNQAGQAGGRGRPRSDHFIPLQRCFTGIVMVPRSSGGSLKSPGGTTTGTSSFPSSRRKKRWFSSL